MARLARTRARAEDRPIGRQLAFFATLSLVVIAALVGYHEWDYQRLSRALDADLGTLRRLRWERPVLRGTASEGNAAVEAFSALSGWKDLSDGAREALANNVHYGGALSAELTALLAERAEPLDRLRAATRRGFSRTELVPELGADMHVPVYPRVVDASLLLLARGAAAAPDECLRVACDVIRLGQDLVPGGPLEAASVSMRLTSIAAPVITRCATSADTTTLRRAAHELRTLATTPPPTGAALELHDLVTAMKLRSKAALTNKSGPGEVIDTLIERPSLLAAWALYTDPTRFRKLTPQAYPDALDDWKQEQDSRTRSALPFVAADAAPVLDFLYDDMRGQALLRALAVGMATLAERTYRGKLPTDATSAKEPLLHDPFRGRPLSYRIAPDGSRFLVWSVGEDLRDDNGSSDWGDAAPQDVAVHFAVASAITVQAQKPKRTP